MMNTASLLTIAASTVSAVAIIWILLCLALRHTNFKTTGGREHNKHHEEDDKRRSEVIEYHNHAVYRAFEFYLKITLAVFGGIAYVATSDKSGPKEVVATLIDAGSWLLLAAAFLFSVVIFVHQKSKVERWVTRYKWWEPLLWNEFWFIAVMLTVSIVVRLMLIPTLFKMHQP
jgi:uncharacterized membrane protein